MRRIFWLSFILLFGEILGIRWLGIEIPTIRVFPNLVMMVCLVAASAGISKASSAAQNNTTKFYIVTAAAMLLILPLIFAVPLGLPHLSIKFGGSVEGNIAFSLIVMSLVITAL